MAWFSLKYYNFKIIDTRALQQKLQVGMWLISVNVVINFGSLQ